MKILITEENKNIKFDMICTLYTPLIILFQLSRCKSVLSWKRSISRSFRKNGLYSAFRAANPTADNISRCFAIRLQKYKYWNVFQFVSYGKRQKMFSRYLQQWCTTLTLLPYSIGITQSKRRNSRSNVILS